MRKEQIFQNKVAMAYCIHSILAPKLRPFLQEVSNHQYDSTCLALTNHKKPECYEGKG